jgi:hypothetical protein
MRYATLFARCLSVTSALMPIQVLASTDETPGGFKFGEAYVSIGTGKRGTCQIELASPSENRKQQIECLAFQANKTENFVSYHFFKPGNKADTWLTFYLYPKENVGIVGIEEGNTKIKRAVSLDKVKCNGYEMLTDIYRQPYTARVHICSADIPGLKVEGLFTLER